MLRVLHSAFTVVGIKPRNQTSTSSSVGSGEKIYRATSMEEFHIFQLSSSSFLLLSKYVSNFQFDHIISQIYPNTFNVSIQHLLYFIEMVRRLLILFSMALKYQIVKISLQFHSQTFNCTFSNFQFFMYTLMYTWILQYLISMYT